jgi:hypothetical protein
MVKQYSSGKYHIDFFMYSENELSLDYLYEISLKSEDEFEHTPKTIVAGVIAKVMNLKSKSDMKIVSDVSGVSSLSIHKIVGKI